MDNYKQCFSLSDIDPNNEFISATYQHPSHNPYFSESLTLHRHNSTALQQHFDIQRKRKSAMEIISSSSDTKNSVGGGKKGKRESKSAEVVHVRAKRGQATDSHSLAERVRREKINERLRCLQDIVPGCYKTMGMAVMLDEIINYVQSLQNQVEFLSMKLTAASSFYNFNSEADALETMQRAKAYNAVNIENGGGPGIPSAQLGCNFQYCPQVPHNK